MLSVAPAPVITPADRLGLTLFFAIAAHAIVVLGVTFAPTDKSRIRSSTLDIILVQNNAREAPKDADFLAQASQDGGGEQDEPDRPATPLPAPLANAEAALVSSSPPVPAPPSPQVAPPEPAPPKPAPPKPAPKPILSQAKTPTKQKVARKPPPKPQPRKPPEPKAKAPARPAPAAKPTQTMSAAALINRSRKLASLSAELDQRLKAYAKRPRRKWISARTREYKYAAYMEAWRAKVERIGNLNYPDQARRQKLAGNLLLDVALRPDGKIGDVTLRRSSGHRVLDDAAIRIVKLAAPFAPFPKEIRKEIDILHIERTWQFLGNNRWASK